MVDIRDSRRFAVFLSDLFLNRLPQGFRGRVETAVMANLIQIYTRQKRLIPLLAECVSPVLVLRIAWEEKLLLANLEKQNYAGVVHFLIKRAHDFEQLLA